MTRSSGIRGSAGFPELLLFNPVGNEGMSRRPNPLLYEDFIGDQRLAPADRRKMRGMLEARGTGGGRAHFRRIDAESQMRKVGLAE